jgi:hypothetical protein
MFYSIRMLTIACSNQYMSPHAFFNYIRERALEQFIRTPMATTACQRFHLKKVK